VRKGEKKVSSSNPLSSTSGGRRGEKGEKERCGTTVQGKKKKQSREAKEEKGRSSFLLSRIKRRRVLVHLAGREGGNGVVITEEGERRERVAPHLHP